MSKFSSTLTLADLDDFISPSQECVKPVETVKPVRNNSASIRLGSDGSLVELNSEGEVAVLKKAKVTLNDCLACSGCITSAESVLIGQQSVDEVYKALAQSKSSTAADACDTKPLPLVVVFSVSPQSRASLAAHYGLAVSEASLKLAAFFRSLGAARVLDTTMARDISLIESCKEFVQRKMDAINSRRSGNLPMLTSACPGWVCYAEKAHGVYILPYISSVKSPQQIMGSIVKDFVAQRLGVTSPDRVYHVAVMPCYDKKLEASRPDFWDSVHNTRDVDCVITTGEVLQMVQAEGLTSLDDVDASVADAAAYSLFDDIPYTPYVHEGGGSGGYLVHVFKYAARELFGETVSSLNYQVKRNQDFQEVVLRVGSEVKLTFALAYGFRNIQNIVQKVKQGRCPYDFVEVMACPSGCLNGGGQVRSMAAEGSSETASAREVLQRVTNLYNELPIVEPCSNEVTARLYREWLGGEGTDKAARLLHTQYHAVEKPISALTLKW